MNSIWTTSELEKLRGKLPADWKETLASEFAISEGRVSNILRGQKPNDLVILRAVTLANEHQQKVQTAKEAIAAL